MKGIFILGMAGLVRAAGIAVAEQSTLIDFNDLAADYPADDPVNDEDTLVDFSGVAGSSFTEEELAQMKTSLAIQNWEVVLASSSRSVMNQSQSLVRPAPVNEDASQFPGETVLGVRVHFPTEPFNSWALVRPPFEIPAYADVTQVEGDDLIVPQEEQGRGRKFDSRGVVKNVGTLRSVSMNVHGLNFPHGISLVMQDENSETQEIFMGYVEFDGWRTLEWRNPNYITEVRNRELQRFPLYPNLAPMRKLVGIRVYRDAAMQGGDFVTYVKDITITYDRAVLQLERDIDDEAIWGILQEREEARRNAELRRLGQQQVLRFLERQKMHSPDDMGEQDGEE